MGRGLPRWRGVGVAGLALVGAVAACNDDGGTRLTLRMPEDPGVGADATLAFELFYADATGGVELSRRYDPELDRGSVTAAELVAGQPWLLESDAHHDLQVVAVVFADVDGDGLPGAQEQAWLAAAEVAVDPDVARSYELTLASVRAGPGAALWDDCETIAPDVAPGVDVWADERAAVLGTCVRWRSEAGAPVYSMGRVGDRDCDGVPPDTGLACVVDAAQCSRTVPETGIDPRIDADGDGYVAGVADLGVILDGCTPCLDTEGVRVPCECDQDSPTALSHFGLAEMCDGIDNDCDDTTSGDEHLAGSVCFTVNPSSECEPGIWGCDDDLSTPDEKFLTCFRDDQWKGVGCGNASMHCVGGACVTTGVVPQTCTRFFDGAGPCNGVARPIALVDMEIGNVFPDGSCDAKLIGGTQAGWQLLLSGSDAVNPSNMVDASAEVEHVLCRSLAVVAEGAPADQAIDAMISLTPAGAAVPRVLLPVNFKTSLGTCPDGDAGFPCDNL
ncbi:MAG: hypothetical protein R2939_01225 [Kofleriaceae bacterium]